jgi:hypothetical protein
MNTMRVGAEDGKSLVPVDLAGLVGGVYGATQWTHCGSEVQEWGRLRNEVFWNRFK